MFLQAPVCPFHIQCFVSALSLAMKTYCQFVKSNPFCCQWPAFFGYFYETTLARGQIAKEVGAYLMVDMRPEDQQIKNEIFMDF